MSTALQQPPRSAFDRAAAWILDPDGVMYGDEQERLRYYESSTIVASIQGVLLPWMLVACAWLGGRAVAPYLLAIGVVYIGTWAIGSAYVVRRRVRRVPSRLTKQFVVLAVVTGLPYGLFAAGLAHAFAEGTRNGFVNGLVGGMLGGAIAGVLVLVVGLVRASRRPAQELPDEGDE